jgi:RNA polymerase sigma factor (sigma-70 family)
MSDVRVESMFRQVSRLAGWDQQPRLSDGELLDRFVAVREEAAFAELLRRHGPLVLAVCRRMLPQLQDAEDVFQATFLVLARKADSVREPAALAGWLHQVASRIALRMRASAARRHDAERRAARLDEAASNESSGDLRLLLDEALQSLPEKYRLPLILCYLQERSNVEAAALLGWPSGTMSRRLAKARDLLRQRLRGRGVAVTAGTLAAFLAAQHAGAAPAALVSGTAQAALGFLAGKAGAAASAHLAQGMLSMLYWQKCKSALLAALVLCCFALGGGALLYHAARTEAAPDAPQQPPKAEQKPGPEPPLPEEALARLGSLRMRHGGPMTAVAFSPDGKLLGSGGMDWHSHIWQPEEGKDFRNFAGHGSWVLAVAWSPDNTLFASASKDQTVQIWDVAKAKSVCILKKDKQGPVNAVVFLDDKTVATASEDGAIRLWDLGKVQVTQELIGHQGAVFGLARSPDGKELVSAGADGTLRVWDPAGGKELRQLPTGNRVTPFTSVAFSPDGKKIAASCTDGLVRAWDVAAKKELPQMVGHKGPVRCVAWSKDSKTVASGGDDQSIRLWDAATSNEDRSIAANCGKVAGLSFSRDGKTLAAAYQQSVIRLWDPATGKEVRPISGHNGPVYTIAHCAAAKLTATGSTDGSVVVWDAATNKELRRWEAHEAAVNALAFTPNGKTLVSAGADQVVCLWDPATGKKLAELKGHADAVTWAAVSPDGKLLATSSWDQTVRLWDLATHKKKDVLKSRGPLRVVAFSHDGKLLAAGGEPTQNGLVIWETASGKELMQIPKPGDRSTTSIAFSRDDRMIFTGTADGRVRAWETATAQMRYENPEKLHLGDWGFVAVAVSPDGGFLSAGTGGRWIIFWDITRMEEVGRFKGHVGWVRQLVYAPDGKTMYSASDDTTGLAWDMTRVRRRAPADTELSEVQLARLWQELNDKDGVKSFDAMQKLTAAPKSSVPYLYGRVRVEPLTEERAKKIAELIKALDADDFDRREAAQQELAKIGKAAEPALVKALEGQPSAEARVRVGALLDKLRGPGDKGGISVTTLRVLEVLERAGTPEARKALEELSKQTSDPALAAEAKAAAGRPPAPR